MSIDIWLAFVLATTILLVIPGPTILTVISYSVSHGYNAKLPLIMAVALADATAITLSLFGLSALLEQSAFWFQLVKWAGGLYLIFLGIRLFVADTTAQSLDPSKEKHSNWSLFFNTYLVTVLNPKGIIFFVAFLPQFLNTDNDVTRQLGILSITFVILAAINAALYSTFAEKARTLLSSVAAQRRFNRSGGSLLAVAGVWSLTAKQF